MHKGNLIRHIEESYKILSKGQKAIADYILNHYDKAAYITASKLGDIVGVSESTVVRFAIEIGFEGYPEFQKELQELIKSKLTSIQRMEISSNRIGEGSILKNVLTNDMEKIKLTLEELDEVEFEVIVEKILRAKRIFILGVRSVAPLASFLGFYFSLVFDNVVVVNAMGASELFEQIIKANENDVVISISFPRYSRRTIKAMEFVKRQGATTIALTDNNKSPLAQCSDHVLFARSDMASFVDSLVAPLSVINALIVAVGVRRKEQVYKTFNKLESMWDEYQVYMKHEEEEE
jgi:DNA-binding MurR/RpiR family transcriptional regulator